MSLVPFTFNKVELKVVTVNGKQWCRAKEACKALEYEKRSKDVIRAHCSQENIRHKYELARGPLAWPSDSQKHDFYISEEGLYELVFYSSQQPLAL